MSVPKEIITIGKALQKAGFEAYLVGGCVRDLILSEVEGRPHPPQDWDIATSARPEEIQRLFPESVYENTFGTVAVKTDSKDERLKIIEITTYRLEGRYSDARHPDEIKFAATIEEDLSRRDFTVNAMALKIQDAKFVTRDLVDPYGGQKDIKLKTIRAVGDPAKRFREDALRLLRAIRLSTELEFTIEPATLSALHTNALLLKKIASERVRDELIKIIASPRAALGIRILESTGLLRHVIPELTEAIGCKQNKHHIYDVFEHSIRSLDYTASKNYSLAIRLAALFHDIGKPRTKRGIGEDATFYSHEIVGARITQKILERLHFPRELADDIIHLVRYHMFNYAVGEVSPAGVRRLLARVGLEYIDPLIHLREADRIGSGVPKAVPYKLRHLLYMIDRVRRDPISPKMLKLNGTDLMSLLKITPSPRVGMILNALLEEVINNPKHNTKTTLSKRAKELNKLSDQELSTLMAESKKKQAAFEEAADEDIKTRHYVK